MNIHLQCCAGLARLAIIFVRSVLPAGAAASAAEADALILQMRSVLS